MTGSVSKSLTRSVLVLLFMKYVSDKAASQKAAVILS